nr:transposase [Enterocloster clostridioformis]
MENYLHNYFPCFSLQPQRRLFQTFIQGLLSPLERKSIEPVALHFSGEKYVRPLQRFFTRSPFDKQPLPDTYQELLSRQIGAGCGMLSVGDTSFVKKEKHSAGVKQQYSGCLGKTENCQSGVFLACTGDKGYGLVDYEPYISAGRRGKGPDPCRAEIPALFFRPCGREPKLCEARGGNMALSEEIRR